MPKPSGNGDDSLNGFRRLDDAQLDALAEEIDVLQVIGPVISARSDTFRIRSYGEAIDPAGKTVASAWCEAIVQRTPEYVDAADAPETRPGLGGRFRRRGTGNGGGLRGAAAQR